MSKTFEAFRRHLPVLDSQETTFAGIIRRWLAADAVGSLTNPSYAVLDLRVQYRRNLASFLFGEGIL